MDVSQTPFFSLLRQQLDHLGERQKLVSENIANVSTPGYTPRDTDEAAFAKAMSSHGSGPVTIARTDPHHMGGASGGSGAVKIIKDPDSETTLDGNSVVLEDQMMKAAQTRMDFETSLSLYQKGLELVRLAIKPPGR